MNVQNDTFAKFWYITVQTVIILTECIILLFIHYIFVYCEFIVEKIMWDHVDREQHKREALFDLFTVFPCMFSAFTFLIFLAK